MLNNIKDLIEQSQSILITTHKNCDGDGLGSELGLYHALKSTNKKVRILNVDGTPKKYDYLKPNEFIQYFDSKHDAIESYDLALVFDTNDWRLISPLYEKLEHHCKHIRFIDHHPLLKTGPEPVTGSWINTDAASTGEMTFDLINALKLPISQDCAMAIYSSIAFDTQLFRYVRSSPRSYEIAAELMKTGIDVSQVHRHLFGNFTASKLKFLSKTLADIEFFHNDRLGFLHIKTSDIHRMGLDIDDSRDLVDAIMNVESVEAAVTVREDGENNFKLSLRSKGRLEVNSIAEYFGGGGHVYSSGASTQLSLKEIKEKILELITFE